MPKRRKATSLVEHVRTVYRNRYFIVMSRGRFGLSTIAGVCAFYRRHVVLHVLNGQVNALTLFTNFTGDTNLFEHEDAEQSYGPMTVNEGINLGAHLLEFVAGRMESSAQLCLVVCRHAATTSTRHSPSHLSVTTHYPNVQEVFEYELSADVFGTDADLNDEVMVRHSELKNTLGVVAELLSLVIRTHRS